jgi:hypothetical protein
MSNKTKAAGTRRRHAPQHRKEPSWTVSDLAAMPGGLGAKIVVTGVAGATLALPATSAFASPSSIPTSPGPGLISVTRAAGQGTAFRVHPIAGHGRNRATHGAANQGIHVRPTVAASDPAGPAAPGPGLLLEPNGTFMTLPQSATNVHTVPAGSLLITSNGIMMRPLSGTYATIYGLITVSQAPGSGTPLAAGMTPGTVSVNPGGPLQAPAGAPAAFGAGPVAPTLTPASVTTPTPIATPTPVATPTPAAISTAAKAPVAATAAAKPAVQIVSAMGGATIADNGTVTPNGSVNLAFPGSGIGGSLPLSLPSAAPAQAAQPAFPAADQNAVLTDPIFQSLIQNLSQPPSVNQPGPILNPLQNVASTAPAMAASTANQFAANTFDANGNPIASDASQPPVQLAQNQATTPSLTPDSLTVILPDGTPQTFPLGSRTNPLAPPTFGPGSEILVPLGTQVPLPNGGSTTLDSAGTLTFPNLGLPAIHAVPAMPTSDNSPDGTTAVAMNNVAPQTGAPVASDANGGTTGGAAPAPAPVATPAPAPTNVAPAPAPTDTAPAPAPTNVAPAPAPTDTAPAPAPTDVAPAPVPTDVAPAPAPVAAPSGFTSSDPSTAGDPLGSPAVVASNFGGGGGSFGGGSSVG